MGHAVSVPRSACGGSRIVRPRPPSMSTRRRARLVAVADVPLASLDDLRWEDGIAFGTPTRFGNVASQMKQFIATQGPLWAEGALADKAVTGHDACSPCRRRRMTRFLTSDGTARARRESGDGPTIVERARSATSQGARAGDPGAGHSGKAVAFFSGTTRNNA